MNPTRLRPRHPSIKKKKLSSKSPALLELNDYKAFIEYENDIDDIYKNIEEYNPKKTRKVLIVFDDMVADMFSDN